MVSGSQVPGLGAGIHPCGQISADSDVERLARGIQVSGALALIAICKYIGMEERGGIKFHFRSFQFFSGHIVLHAIYSERVFMV